MTSNVRKVQYRNRSYWVTIPPAMVADKRIEGLAEWRSLPTNEDDWRRMLREHPGALVLIPVEEAGDETNA